MGSLAIMISLAVSLLFANANGVSSKKEDLDKITLALLDIRDVLAEANHYQGLYRQQSVGEKVNDTVNKTIEFSLLVNATTSKLDELNTVAIKHGDLLAYLLNRVNEMHDGMTAVATEIVARENASSEMTAKFDTLAKDMEDRDLVVKRLQENFAAMAKEVLLKDLITVELRDRLAEVTESLHEKNQEVRSLREDLESLTVVVESLRGNCCTSKNEEEPDLQALATATYLVYGNNSVKSTDTIFANESHNKAGGNASLKDCLLPYKKLGRSCFYVHTGDVRTWHEAREYCRHLRGDLAEPSGNLFSLRAYLQGRQDTSKGFFWLGATDETNPGIWLWVSGAPVSMAGNVWAVGQPDGREQHCLYLDSSKQFKAGNLGCQNHTYFICEYKLA
ncbi:hypothetical protein SK128_012779 [Halocaridina rubra]|uniref:C-type lectin domain-containing protein n=1 Tax=Halocaridina rubra TaxID=373956 RepID=A0AAN8WUB9_HALRR